MVEGLFFYGINMHRTWISIGQRIEFTPDIYPGAAHTAVARFQIAPIRADPALDIFSVGRIIKGLDGPPPWFIRGISFKDMPFYAFEPGFLL